ncbi:MAG: hypothetical protein RI935_235 [Candidatus Parcubacteria bacterium]|jgi:putative endonuclease
MAEHNEIGKIGEKLALSFLVKLGFSVISKNFRTKHGEIDIIAKKDNIFHFIEVKSIKVISLDSVYISKIQPEDNLTFAKWSKLLIAILEYKKINGISDTIKEQIDLACVYIDNNKREGRVKLLENIHKE